MVGRRSVFGLHRRVQSDLFAGGEALLIFAGPAQRDHEREFVFGIVRGQVAPADVVDVVAGPRGGLIGLVAQNTGGATLVAGQLVNRSDAAPSQDDTPFDVPALVVLCSRAGADVDKSGGDVGGLRIIGESDRHLAVIGD